MPYCAKCGIEVNNNTKTCPLCEFPIPDVGEHGNQHPINAFPDADNIYKNRMEIIKNKVFFSLILLLIFTIPILISIRAFYPSITIGINYAIISILASLFYLFFLFGYLTINYNILGIGITSIILSYVLDSIDHSITWFYQYAFFIILLVMVVVYLYVFLYKRSKHQNQLIYVPTYIFSGIGILCIGIEALITYRINYSIKLSWSIIVLVCSVTICLLLLGLYHGLPERVRNEIKRKLHV